jgi:hypothetical protein
MSSLVHDSEEWREMTAPLVVTDDSQAAAQSSHNTKLQTC